MKVNPCTLTVWVLDNLVNLVKNVERSAEETVRLIRKDENVHRGLMKSGSAYSLRDEAEGTRGREWTVTEFGSGVCFVDALTTLSESLSGCVDKDQALKDGLREMSSKMASWFAEGCIRLPLNFGLRKKSSKNERNIAIVKAVCIEESVLFATKERVPYLVSLEVVDSNEFEMDPFQGDSDSVSSVNFSDALTSKVKVTTSIDSQKRPEFIHRVGMVQYRLRISEIEIDRN